MMWPAVLLAALLGGVIPPLTGFGSGVIMMIALSAFFDMTVAPTLSAAICFFQSLLLFWTCRRSLRLRKHLPVVVAYLLCSAGIIAVLGNFDLTLLSAIFGGFLVVLAIYFLFFAGRFTLRPTPATGLLCGIVSGCCAGAFSIGGPTIALYYVAACEDNDTYLANMQFLFMLSNFLLAAQRMAQGFYDMSLTPLLIASSVVIVIGTFIGRKLTQKMSGETLRKIVYVGVGVSGIVTLLQRTVLN